MGRNGREPGEEGVGKLGATGENGAVSLKVWREAGVLVTRCLGKPGGP